VRTDAAKTGTAVLLASRGREQNYVPFRRNIVRTLDAVRIDR
jgi:hypothetical protein